MQAPDKSFKPGWTKILSEGRVTVARLNSKVLPHSFIPTSTIIALSSVILVSAVCLLIPTDKLALKTANLFSPTGISLVARTAEDIQSENAESLAKPEVQMARSSQVVFSLNSATATELPSELAADLAQALLSLSKKDMTPFTPFPKDLNSFATDKFSYAQATDTSAFIAIPIAHYRQFMDTTAAPPVLKYRMADATFIDKPVMGALRLASDTLFFAAVRKEQDKWVAYNFKPTNSRFNQEVLKEISVVTQDMIQNTFDSAFTAPKK
jgi:hypothetical protein